MSAKCRLGGQTRTHPLGVSLFARVEIPWTHLQKPFLDQNPMDQTA